MKLHRLRIGVDDVPGRLGAVAAALGGIGVNILEVDVHSNAGGERIDELLVDLVLPVDIPAIEHAVVVAGAALLTMEPADPHELRDRVTAALDGAHAVVSAVGPDATGVEDAARHLVRAELVWVARHDGPATDHDLVRRVRASRSPVQLDAPLKRLPGAATTWWLGLPCAGDAVLVLIRRGPRFSYTETARAQALLRLLDARPEDAESTSLADGGAILVREADEADLQPVRRLHDRCSAESIRRRYFSALPKEADDLFRVHVTSGGERGVAVVAAIGSEIVGTAQAVPSRHGEIELSFLVEDGHQRRGIGRALFERLVRTLSERGVDSAFAITLPDNEPLRRLLGAAQAGASLEDGVVRLDVRVERTATAGTSRAGERRSMSRAP